MDLMFEQACRRLGNEHDVGRGSSAATTTMTAPDPAGAIDAALDPYSRYVRTVWRAIVQRAAAERRPIVVYGAGSHTDWLLDITSDLPGPRARRIIDDRPKRDAIRGVPVGQADAITIDPGTILLISSDVYEGQLADNARRRFGDTVEIVRFYQGMPPGPYPRPESPASVARRRDATRRARQRWGGGEFVGPYEQAGYVTGFLEEQWLWRHRERITGHVLDMSTPRHWHAWIYELPGITRVSISDLDGETVSKLGHGSPVDIRGDFCGPDSPVDPDSFDTAICGSILEHCAEPPAMLANLYRVLKPGGHLLLTVPFACVDGHCRPDYWRFGQDGLQKLGREAGFAHIETAGLGDIGGVLADVLGEDASVCNSHHGLPLLNALWASKGDGPRNVRPGSLPH